MIRLAFTFMCLPAMAQAGVLICDLTPLSCTEGISFPTRGHADREIITLFNGFHAIHTGHFTIDGQPAAQTSTGHCTSFY